MNNMSPTNNIRFVNGVFELETQNTSYLFRVTPFKHLEHLYYGIKVEINDADALSLKRNCGYGDSVYYDPRDDKYCLDVLPLEFSGSGTGDFREAMLEWEVNGSNTADFVYDHYEIIEGNLNLEKLPDGHKAEATLIVYLKDLVTKAQLELNYTIYPDCDVISRSCKLLNNGEAIIKLRKLMSLGFDCLQEELEVITFNGLWAKEVQKKVSKLQGTIINESRVGFSSSRTNPGFILKKPLTTEDQGEAWGFNLIYSGSHYSSISLDLRGSVRIQTGIQPERFNLEIKPGEAFETPVAVMSYSDQGLNDLSHHFHDFVNNHLVNPHWANRERPILINSWEAFMFSFDQNKLLSLAKKAKDSGVELFVLDDGWFGKRNNDLAGLGDYEPNPKKLSQGIIGLAQKIHSLGMKFGLWFEPEAINPDSDLYRAHPDWAIKEEDRPEFYGRHELLLDLTKIEVKDYIVNKVSEILDSAKVDYVKWDMNRQLVGVSGEYSYRYILSLYEILGRIFKARPEILLESCSSGGNRFDLGMMAYSPQIWASDDTDPIERLRIQKNYSYLYPLSVMGAHVSASPCAQTLRKTPLATRFQVACYGDLGYELDLNRLSPLELKEIKAQISFYVKHRSLFQYGRFYRFDNQENKETFEVVKDNKAIVTKYRLLQPVSPGYDKLEVKGIDPKANYEIDSREFKLNIEMFGQLIEQVLPVKVNSQGLLVREAGKHLGLDTGKQHYEASGKALKAGIGLNNVFNGAGYNEHIRVPGDFGSEMYIIKNREITSIKEGHNDQTGNEE